MSYSSNRSQYDHARGGGIGPKAPPPPVLKDFHESRSSGRHGRFGSSRSRSRSPGSQRRHTTGPGQRSTRHDNSNSRTGGYGNSERERGRGGSRRRSRSRSTNVRSSTISREEPTSSNSFPSYIGVTDDPKSRPSVPQQQLISRIAPVDPSTSTIVRTILNPELVKIPRRENEGLKPIFDRDELRDAIKRRMECGDNEQNPNYPEQRVVAIIREPLPMQPQFVQQEIIPILPTQYMPEQLIQQPTNPRFETSTGVTYSYSKEPSRSRSPARQELRPDRSNRRGGSPRMARAPRDTFRSRRGSSPVRRSTRSRSGSPVARVDRSFRMPRNTEFPSLRVPAHNMRRTERIPNRGPWKHDMYGRDEDATEERSSRPTLAGRGD